MKDKTHEQEAAFEYAKTTLSPPVYLGKHVFSVSNEAMEQAFLAGVEYQKQQSISGTESDSLKVKALAHEDILAEGYECDGLEGYILTYILNQDNYMRFNPHVQENNIYITSTGGVSVFYTIRTAMELRDLMRFLGIANNTE